MACPSLALDRTVLVDRLCPGELHRPLRVDARGGGKGGNVARVLAVLGVRVHLVGIVGPKNDPAAGAVLRSLEHAGVRVSPVHGSATRTCTTVVERSGTPVTAFYEPAPHCEPQLWADFAATAAAAGAGRIVVLAGSLPPGVSTDSMAQLARNMRDAGATVVCDLADAALAAVLASRPHVVTPNAFEAAKALGVVGESADLQPVGLAQALVAAGADAAVVSAGPDGLGMATAQPPRAYRLPAPAVLECNPTGAGDVLTATIAYGLHANQPLAAAAAEAARLASESCTTFPAAELPSGCEVPSWQP